ncbi:MAG TPA: ISL3 family transposase [Terriglobia bacterium]|nr:ISL3 family transposase [Terriglobia bacterium]
MRVKSILNQVEKYKDFVYERVRWQEEGQERVLVVEVRPRAHRPGRCSECGNPRPGYDRLPARQFEYVPLWGISVYFLYALRRVQCPGCGIKVEAVPWAQGKQTLTRSYMQFLATWARRVSWQEVARFFHTSWEKVFHSVCAQVEWGLAHRDLSGIQALGIDETSWQRGHRYLTVVYQLDAEMRRLLWVGERRTAETLRQFFACFGPDRTRQLRFICSDLWQPYLDVIAQKASQALHVLDRFHVALNLNKAVDQVRMEESQELRRKGFEPILTHTRWCLLKRPEHLSPRQEIKLADLLRANLRTVRAYLLKEELGQFWTWTVVGWARKFLHGWFHRVLRSRLEPLKRVARTLRTHEPLLLNWFRANKQISSGPTEGLNNRLQLTLRKAYGFRTFRAAEVALYHTLGALPEPEATHRFC